MLDRQVEERARALDGLVPRHALAKPLERYLEALPEVDERVAGDDGAVVVDPEHDFVCFPARERLDSGQRPVAGAVWAGGVLRLDNFRRRE